MQRFLLVLALSVFVAGCELVGDVFQAGLIVGIVIIIALLAIAGWLFRVVRGRRPR